LGDVRFVPLIGVHGWSERDAAPAPAMLARKPPRTDEEGLAGDLARVCEPFSDIETFDPASLLRRIGDARIVLIGEATHGTSEFYRMRAQITQALIESKSFRFVAIEGDWPDTARIDHYVRHSDRPPSEWKAFARFPQWMWRNAETAAFIDWLHARNASLAPERRTAFHGLDLYSMHTSAGEVIAYLERTDPNAATVARNRYACLTPWQADPASYGEAVLSRSFEDCEEEVIDMLVELLQQRDRYSARDGERFLDAAQNARLVANAERYYRTMYYGSKSSWNLRDTHMFETLQHLLEFYGPDARAVVWAHNSHVGNAIATEMSVRGEHNIGQLCREKFGARSYAIGFGTHDGTVAAASNWNALMEIKKVRPSHPKSYEHLCHMSMRPRFLLPLRMDAAHVVEALRAPRLERAIGVIYRPNSELASHYFYASLPLQFDEYVWIDRTNAVTALDTQMLKGMPDTYPFGI
jgi:protein-L-isoaspartate(D-aspartate) O-methyltransferase